MPVTTVVTAIAIAICFEAFVDWEPSRLGRFVDQTKIVDCSRAMAAPLVQRPWKVHT